MIRKTKLSKKKILFISHDALRTGAPIIFLNFLRWFRDNASIPFRIMLRNGGELEPEFQAIAPVIVFNRKIRLRRGLDKIPILFHRLKAVANRIHLNSLKKQLLQDNIGLIYSNTVINGEVLEFLSFLDCPIITHVHELEYWIRQAGANFNRVKKYTQHYITVSEAVKKNLIQYHKIPEKKIEVVYGFIPTSSVEIKTQKTNNMRKVLNIPQNAFIIGGSGFENWRKGQDLFIQLAISVSQKFKERPIHFVWVGGNQNGINFYKKKHDIRLAGIEDWVHFISQISNPMDYYSVFDVFTMVSREDPFPLVNLEVAALGKPIVCFDNAGGTPEFVADDAGFVVSYLDIEAMADKVICLAKDEVLRKRLGAVAMHKVKERHTIEIGAPKILEIIERFL